jgi:APA family basic amino acid/polyamine antiporter
VPGGRRFIGYSTAVTLVIANMIGTGVFTTLGLQAEVVPNGAALLLLWILGGVVALCGALSYAELAAALPRSGGEYHFLSRIYHPALGQLAGWISVTVGFSAPVALAAMALGRYAGTFLPVEPMAIAVAAIILVTLVHAFDVQAGGTFQVGATVLKVLVLVVFCVGGLLHGRVPGSLDLTPSPRTLDAVLSVPFALSLIYVSYAYSGWNAAAYVVGEVRDPRHVVPRALVHGTIVVTLLYLVLNLTFLRTVSLSQLAGTVEVGAASAANAFGPAGGTILSAAVSLTLISTISAMVLAGPRVLEVIGEDIPALRFLARHSRRGAPTRAVLLQQGLALAFVATDSFEAVLTFAGFTLTLFALLTVLGVMRLRHKEPDLPRPFRLPLYPLPPIFFAVLSGLSVAVVAWGRPLTVLACVALLAVGWGLLRNAPSGSTA